MEHLEDGRYKLSEAWWRICASMNWVIIGSHNGMMSEPMVSYCQLDPEKQILLEF